MHTLNCRDAIHRVRYIICGRNKLRPYDVMIHNDNHVNMIGVAVGRGSDMNIHARSAYIVISNSSLLGYYCPPPGCTAALGA